MVEPLLWFQEKRINMPGCKIDQFGTKRWLIHDQLHRENGPAVVYTDGSKAWFLHGQRHRLDGPAIEHANGYKAWYYHGQLINCFCQKEFERLIKLKALW